MATPFVQRYRSGMGKQYQGTIRDALRAAQQQERLMGRTLSPAQREGIIRGVMLPYVESYGYGLERASERESEEKRYEQDFELREDQFSLQKQANIASALGQGAQLGLLGAGLYGYGKGAGWWGGPTAAAAGADFTHFPGSTALIPPGTRPGIPGAAPAGPFAAPNPMSGYPIDPTTGGPMFAPADVSFAGAPASYSQIAATEGLGTAPYAGMKGAAVESTMAPSLSAQFATGAPIAVPSLAVIGASLASDDFAAPRALVKGTPEFFEAGGKAVAETVTKAPKTVGKGVKKLAKETWDVVDPGCIIVTACHGKDSEEVNITREYRDKHLDSDTLRGYYMLAEIVIPFMKNSDDVKNAVKKNLVNSLINVGRARLNGKEGEADVKDIAVTEAFLNTCRLLGQQTPIFTRSNGEVV